MTFLRTLFCLILCICTPVLPAIHVSADASPDGAVTLDDQFTLFLKWFPGRYDSALQTRTDELDKVPVAERNYRRHSIFRQVALPAFGDVVFYAEQYRDGDPNQVYRQRLYVFSLDAGRQAIRLRVHVPHDVETIRGAYRDPALLAGLTPDKTTVWPGCDLWWQWEGDHFRGVLDPGACRFDSEAFAQEIVLDEYLLLDSDSIQFADRGLALDGSYLFGMRGEVPNLSRKVRPFLCTTRQEDVASTVWIHDQGGRVETSAGYLHLQRWNAAARDRGLRLALSGATGSPLATAIAAQDAESIGLVSGSFEAVCGSSPNSLYAEAEGLAPAQN